MMLKKFWADPVWSKVIATAICAIFASAPIITYFAGWWPQIITFYEKVIIFTFFETQTPNWVLAILLFCTALLFIFIGIIAWALIFSAQEKNPAIEYTQDDFHKIRWRWQYSRDGRIYGLHSFCPHCDFQVYPQSVSPYLVYDQIEYKCECCGIFLNNFLESPKEVENNVIRYVQKEIRRRISKHNNVNINSPC